MWPPAKVNGVWPFNDAWLRTSLSEADARRHATLPQSWIQRENWDFETHRPEVRTLTEITLPRPHACREGNHGSRGAEAGKPISISILKTSLAVRDRLPSL